MCAFGFRQVKKQRRDEENGQNVPHPVKAEALASLVADDVANLFWDRRRRIGRNARSRQTFWLDQFFHHSEGDQNASDVQLQSDRFRLLRQRAKEIHSRGCAVLNKRLKNEEAHDDSLEEKENCVKLMIALVSRDRSSHQACEIKHAADEICRSQGKKVWNAF